MRCLQCGKAIPLLKRLGGSNEFCSEAHRREYQHEFSQLALGRLLQSQPAEFQMQAERAPILAGATAPAVDQLPATVVTGTPAAGKPSATPHWSEMARPATVLSHTQRSRARNQRGHSRHRNRGEEWGFARSGTAADPGRNQAVPLPVVSQPVATQPVATQPATSQPVVSQPATAPPAAIQKPAPAELQFALVSAPEFEHAFASLAPGRPHREVGLSSAELPRGLALVWANAVEIANSITRPVETKLDLREMSRTTPRIALDLRIVPPESLEIEHQPFTIAAEPPAPAEASLWIGRDRDFAGELASLSGFANDQFSKSDFEVPPLTENPAIDTVSEPLPAEPQPAVVASEPMPEVVSPVSAAAEPLNPEPERAEVESETLPHVSPTVSAVPEPLSAEPQSAIVESEPPPQETHASLAESQTLRPAHYCGQLPDPELVPLPMSSTGIAPGKTKPLPVFGPTPLGIGTVQIPQPTGLPLRPLMVLAAPTAPAIAVKQRNTDIISAQPALSIKPELPPSTAPVSLSSELNLGLPELRTPTPGEGTSRMRKIIAAVAGAAVLGGGLFFFLGKSSDAGSKSPAPASATSVPGSQWIANFAPDAKRQRRVSLLRSSMNLPAYRLDFESSIQMKALGWVYRARDAKNFYVSKIEFQKPGVNPVYALVHYAVIDGVEQPRVETPLPVSVPMGGLYKIHFEAVGNRFTTWVQGQQVEQWTDPRLSSGGAGLYGEGTEQSVLHGDFVVTPLQN